MAKTTAEKIAVMQAFEDGKKVQMLLAGGWSTIDGPVWNWEARDYRIMPEPREWWAIVNQHGDVSQWFRSHDGAGKALICSYSSDRHRIVHVREVIGDTGKQTGE